MTIYESMYKVLFNAITDATCKIEQKNFGLAIDTLKKAQTDAEEIYIQANK